MVRSTEWSAKGLPADLNLRVALHAGPLFRCLDPVTNQPNFTGKQVVPAARLEPVTPPGLVYASREFAAIAAAERSPGFECQLVGRVGLAKKAGAIPVYAVSRR
jgi:class 3 adenylate cyclase